MASRRRDRWHSGGTAHRVAEHSPRGGGRLRSDREKHLAGRVWKPIRGEAQAGAPEERSPPGAERGLREREQEQEPSVAPGRAGQRGAGLQGLAEDFSPAEDGAVQALGLLVETRHDRFSTAERSLGSDLWKMGVF